MEKSYFQKELERDRGIEKNKFRAGKVLEHYAKVDAAENGRSFTESFNIQRMKFPALAKSYDSGAPLPDSGEESEVVAKFYNLQSKTSRRVY